MTKTRIVRCAGALAATAVLLLPAGARAQMPTVTPDGKLAESRGAAAPAIGRLERHLLRRVRRPGPGTRIRGQSEGGLMPSSGESGGAGDTGTGIGYYHMDDHGGSLDDESVGDEGPVQVHGGAVPPVHVVRRGDTLWDISWFYFSNAWEWPRVWSYNPEITNPHWIYPGDQVRLVAGGQLPVDTGGGDGGGAPDEPVAVVPASGDGGGFFEIRQLAFVASDDLKFQIEVAGSPEEKMLLSVGDEIYLSYPKGHPPKVGGRYAVYLERKRVKHPDTGKESGAYVKVVGEVEVISVKQDKNARAVILDSVEPIERGQKVGPLVRQFKNVDTVAPTVDLEGTVVATLTADELIGARQIVFIDRGAKEGVVVGNRMHVVRRGDAYRKVAGPKTGVGQNDEHYPARSIGEIMVVQTGPHSSVAAVVRSDKEFGVGDHVLMTRGGKR